MLRIKGGMNAKRRKHNRTLKRLKDTEELI